MSFSIKKEADVVVVDVEGQLIVGLQDVGRLNGAAVDGRLRIVGDVEQRAERAAHIGDGLALKAQLIVVGPGDNTDHF